MFTNPQVWERGAKPKRPHKPANPEDDEEGTLDKEAVEDTDTPPEEHHIDLEA